MTKVLNLKIVEELIPDKIHEAIACRIQGRIFIFDKESFAEYQTFKKGPSRIEIINGYLARVPPGENSEPVFFHEWLMREVGEGRFRGDLQIHHTTYCKKINIKKYLRRVTKKEHEILHGGYSGLRLMRDDIEIEIDMAHSDETESLEEKCPKCGFEYYYSLREESHTCRNCGYKFDQN